jgi:hypothetical protein
MKAGMKIEPGTEWETAVSPAMQPVIVYAPTLSDEPAEPTKPTMPTIVISKATMQIKVTIKIEIEGGDD